MATKLLKYGLGVLAPAAPEGFVEKTERIEIPVGHDAGVVTMNFAGDISDYVVKLAKGSHASFVIVPPKNRPVSVSVTLAGEGASCETHSAFRADGSDVVDLRHDVTHAAPHTTSNLIVRGALGGSSKSFVRGLVKIPKGMAGCLGRQKEDILMLSDKAEVATMPDLEIACHDVQCGHAATIGRIDPEKLNYFETRGIAREEAIEMIVEGFLTI